MPSFLRSSSWGLLALPCVFPYSSSLRSSQLGQTRSGHPVRGSAIPPPRNPMCRGLSPYQLSRPASFQPRVYLAIRLVFAGTLETPQRIWRIRDSWGQTWLSKARGLLARWSPSLGADHTRAAEGFLQLPGGQPHRGGGRGLGRSWLLGSEPLALQLGLLREPH